MEPVDHCPAAKEQADLSAFETGDKAFEDLVNQLPWRFATRRKRGKPGQQFHAIKQMWQRRFALAGSGRRFFHAERRPHLADDDFHPAFDEQLAPDQASAKQDAVGTAKVAQTPDAIAAADDLGMAA